MMKTPLKILAAIGLCAALATLHSSAQIVLNGSDYTQDFNSIESGLPDGWNIYTGANASSLGSLAAWSLANSSPLSNSWAATSGRFANHASTIANEGTNFLASETAATQQAATNRTLAIRQTGAVGDPGAAFVLRIQDTIGYSDFELDVKLLMLSVQTRSTVWTIDYAIGNSPTAFIPVTTFSDPGTFGSTALNVPFGNALDNQPENVWIRIVALNPSTGSGSRDTFGIDDVVLSYGSSTVTNPVSITSHPTSITNNANTLATFTVGVTGTGPVSYQWYKGDVNNPLFDGGNVTGATAPTLNLSAVSSFDMGDYFVIVTNILNAQTSLVASLTVLDPVITNQPQSRVNLPGDNANFVVGAAGSEPFTYQWFFNGNPIPDAISAALNLTNAFGSNAGNYSVVVSNAFGNAVTSSVAVLSILTPPAQRIARWDFNSTVPDGNTTTGETIPSEGTGTASLLSTNTSIFAGGTFSDPAFVLTSDNSGWNTTTYPGTSLGNKTGGVEFKVSTLGHSGILLAWEQRHSATASKYTRVQYTTDGVNYVDHDVITMETTNATLFVTYTSDLSSVPGVNNNPNFGFRFVTEFESTATGSGSDSYVGTSGTYGTAGTIRFDLVSVYGNVGSTPSPISLTINQVGSDVVLSWANSQFNLQAAPEVTGTYTNIPGATSPYNYPISGAQLFFRLKYP